MKKILNILLILLIIMMASCIEEFWPDLGDNTDNLLVVDGRITNDPGPYTVKLSRSSPLQNPEFIPVIGATVTITDDTGIQEVLKEISDGVYETSETGIQGVVGRSYKLTISTKSGVAFESEYEMIPDPVGVVSLDYKEEKKVVDNTSNTEEDGYQFYLTTDMAPSKNNYYFWELEETYEYHVAYRALFYYDGTYVTPDVAHPLGLHRTLDTDTLFTCYKSGTLKERFTYSTEYLTVPVIENLPLHFIPLTDERLYEKYCVLAKQYTVSKGAYNFMKALENQNANQGGLITVQPYQIVGNISNKKNPDEPVLGYFVAAGVADGPRTFVPAPYYHNVSCGWDTLTYNIRNYIQMSRSDDWPIYFTYVYFPNPDDPYGEAIEALALVHQHCLDCTLKGGKTEKPDFWR